MSKEHAQRRQKSDQQERTVRAKQAETTARTVLPRLTTLPERFDLGEQLVGSHHLFELALPFNIAVGAGVASIEVRAEGDACFDVTAPQHELRESGTLRGESLSDQLAHPLLVRFAPAQKGTFTARLILRAAWGDGHTEDQHVLLIGRARGLEDTPSVAPTEIAREREEAQHAAALHAEEEARYADPSWRAKTVKEGPRADFQEQVHRARRAARSIASQRALGVHTVEQQVQTYKAPNPTLNVWWALAELALTLATSGIAEIAAKSLAVSLGKLVLDAEKDAKAVVVMAAMLKDEMKVASKAALAAVDHGASPRGVGSNVRIGFFETQGEALVNLEDRNSQLVDDREKYLTPVLTDRPAVATAAMAALADTLEATVPAAEHEQKATTTAAWFAVTAQSENKTFDLAGGKVTNMDDGRPDHGSPHPRALAGVLDLDVDLEHGPPRVVSASTRGVAQLAAENLVSVDLARAPMPLRLILSADAPEPTIITRDEVGRIRVSGDMRRLATFHPGEGTPTNEVQAERAARTICDAMLARTLAEWGARIFTDDRSGGGK